MEKKSPQPTVKKKRVQCPDKKRFREWRSKYQFWHQQGIPIASLELLADNIVEIVSTGDPILTWGRVLLTCGVHYEAFNQFELKCPKLRDAKKLALMVIGINREEGALRRHLDGSTVRHMQGAYDKEWRKQSLEHAEIQRHATPENTTKIVVVKEFSRDGELKKLTGSGSNQDGQV